MLKQFWLLFAQVVTIATGLAYVYVTFVQETPVPAREFVTILQGAGQETGRERALTGFRRAVANATPSVVNIYTAKAAAQRRRYESPLYRFFYGEEPPQEEAAVSLGSGVIVSEQGYVLTNNHVVEGADQIAVVFSAGEAAEARVVGTDPESDLAVLKVSGAKLKPITFADPNALQVGDIVLAVGNPFGVGQTVTQGIVSATGRKRLGINTFENFIQTDAAINPGNSGGALVDTDGKLVGINTAIFSQSGGSQGIGFAIPVSLARQVMEQIIKTGHVERGWLGVSARDIAEGPAPAGTKIGAVIAGVQRAGPAERADLRPGDVIVALNDRPISDVATLVDETAALAPGTRGKFKVVRDGREMNVAVELGRRPPVQRRREAR